MCNGEVTRQHKKKNMKKKINFRVWFRIGCDVSFNGMNQRKQWRYEKFSRQEFSLYLNFKFYRNVLYLDLTFLHTHRICRHIQDESKHNQFLDIFSLVETSVSALNPPNNGSSYKKELF